LRSYGFTPDSGPLLSAVGGASVLTAPFGAPATCLAAITAAMCANPESHPDPSQRYWSAVIAGVVYCLFGLFAATITAVASAAPPLVLGTLAGVALIGVFMNSAHAALADATQREAAAVTFLATASGMALFGLSAAVWGLVLGGVVHLVKSRLNRQQRG
jgi:benzoate membrane transport protein